MRKLVMVLVVAGCGPQTSNPMASSADIHEPLSKYDDVFRGVPDNSKLPAPKADGTWPAQYTDLVAQQSPVRDQDRRGVCTIFSTTALMEHLYIKAGMATPDFSEQYLQWSVKVKLGRYSTGEGSNNDDNVEAIHQFGIPEESVWPYNGKEWDATNDPDCKPDGTETQELPTKCWTQGDPPAAAQSAKMYTLPEGQWLSTYAIKEHMSTQKTAVVVGLDFFYQAWNHGGSKLPINRDDFKKGIVRFPNATDIQKSHEERAGHGILLVGWDDNLEVDEIGADGKATGNKQKGFYIFKNSWGTDWFGVDNPYGKGYGFISQKYVEQYGSAYVDDVPDLSMPAPMPTPAPAPAPTCDYNCSDYGYTANQCDSGWQCDADGKCLTNVGTCP